MVNNVTTTTKISNRRTYKTTQLDLQTRTNLTININCNINEKEFGFYIYYGDFDDMIELIKIDLEILK